jgi:hypothetical protein
MSGSLPCVAGGGPGWGWSLLGQCYRPSGFEKYLRVARPAIDPLALGELRLPIAFARELDLDVPGAVPALQLDAPEEILVVLTASSSSASASAIHRRWPDGRESAMAAQPSARARHGSW